MIYLLIIVGITTIIFQVYLYTQKKILLNISFIILLYVGMNLLRIGDYDYLYSMFFCAFATLPIVLNLAHEFRVGGKDRAGKLFFWAKIIALYSLITYIIFLTSRGSMVFV